MPMNKALYPPNWDELAEQMKEAAGWKCETCGAPHGVMVARHKDDPLRWINADGVDTDLLSPNYERPVLVQLGVAHLDQNPGNNNRANLRVLCRGCHLRHDAPYHAVKAAQTKQNKKTDTAMSAGQLLMFGKGE